jgi:CheY-like chemotaxis protein
MANEPQLPTPTVLVVEDEALLLFSISDDLRESGFRVLEAGNADIAVSLLETHPEISILFTDIDMPGSMDGLKLSAAVRARWPPIRILVTSGKQRIKEGDLPSGGRFMPKPYTPDRVVSSLRELLA